jgi:DNA replication protein DnaC
MSGERANQTVAAGDLAQCIGDNIRKVLAERKEMRARLQQAVEPTFCDSHVDVPLELNIEESVARSERNENMTFVFFPCPACVAEAERIHRNRQLVDHGVPLVMVHATLDNWEADTPDAAGTLTLAKRFAELRVGFFIASGPDKGAGKTHLAVGIMRAANVASELFIEAGQLLLQLRRNYQTHDSDPIRDCQRAGLLVLDDLGASFGGKDVEPMLHAILHWRYSRKLPTVITTNLTSKEMIALIGERMRDRMAEATFAFQTVTGASRRKRARDAYFAGNPIAPGGAEA